MGTDQLPLALQALLAPDGNAEIDGLRRLSGGASRETWAFDLLDGGARQALILQRLRPGASASTSSGVGVAIEAALLRAAAEHGVPVARVVASDDGEVLGSAGMVVERLTGETIARKLLRDDEWAVARERLGEQVGAATAAIHAIPVDAVGGLQAVDQVSQYRTVLDALSEPHPAFELGFRWLEANRPPDNAPCVVHGDLRMGNLLVDHDGLAGRARLGARPPR